MSWSNLNIRRLGVPRGNSRAAAAGAWRGGVAWRLARVFFRDERDERDAETTENSKVCALKRCCWRVGAGA